MKVTILNTKGRPKKYSDQQIVACMLYGVKNSIFSLRELECKIKQNPIFPAIVNLKEVPDYLTLSTIYAAIISFNEVILPVPGGPFIENTLPSSGSFEYVKPTTNLWLVSYWWTPNMVGEIHYTELNFGH
ncbi:hypothetical protein [Clostridium botulinum]|uniref:hypothetical protein n=1 Tax=Clostridium botulinum TaxID=1491 RepID=UPI000A174681|nr:hypothetical protein [Clostridium botulinum]OSA78536.1 hypothetical protein B2H89_14650 [Clostridium botulinum]